MLIRPYREGDESEIAVVYNSAFREAIESLPEIYQYKEVSTEDVLDWLHQDTELWIAELDARIIGFVQVHVEIEHGKRDIPVLQIISPRKWDLDQSNIAVHPKFQRSGVGSRLLQVIIEKHKDTTEFITAVSFNDNLAAEMFFQHNGFEMHDIYYFPDYSDEKPIMNSSVYETLELDNLVAPKNLNSEIGFRRATIDDASAIAEIHKHNVWWNPEVRSLEWNKEFIQGKFGHTVFVVEYENEVVGAIDYWEDGRVGISGVLPHMTGKGIGSAMFYKVLLTMREIGYKFAFMDSGMTQVDAIKMYGRFGFTARRRQNAWIRKIK
ncbi:MAG: GNAT family N-acetyltransferase [Candidatus Thorarchaeota archaeon]